jgi:hypothetical protein
MSDEDDEKPMSLEETLRAIADEVQRNLERVSQADLDDIARAAGVDPERARRFVAGAGDWLRTQSEHLGAPTPIRWEDPLRTAAPDPRDVPSEEQGRALAALDSGRWTVEPGTQALASHGEGPGPSDALGLVRELRVHDWIDAEGHVTLVGRAALARWLES